MSGHSTSSMDDVDSEQTFAFKKIRSQSILLIEKPGIVSESLCYVLRTYGFNVELMDITKPPRMTDTVAFLALVHVDADIRSMDWISFFRKKQPDLKLAALLNSGDREMESELLDLGVSCILVGDLSADVAVAALQLTKVGGVFVPPDVIRMAYQRCAIGQASPDPVDQPMAPDGRCVFTPREHEILELLRRGLQNKNIAHALLISESTVKVHLRNIMKKLQATNRTQVAFLIHRDDQLRHR